MVDEFDATAADSILISGCAEHPGEGPVDEQEGGAARTQVPKHLPCRRLGGLPLHDRVCCNRREEDADSNMQHQFPHGEVQHHQAGQYTEQKCGIYQLRLRRFPRALGHDPLTCGVIVPCLS